MQTLLFLLPLSLPLQKISDSMLHCQMLLFLLISVSDTAEDQRLRATLPDTHISPYLCFCHCRRSVTPYYTARCSYFSLSLFLTLQKIRDSVLHCQMLHFSFHCLYFCHCRRSETPCYTARCSISPSTASVSATAEDQRQLILILLCLLDATLNMFTDHLNASEQYTCNILRKCSENGHNIVNMNVDITLLPSFILFRMIIATWLSVTTT